ncbi:RNA polymerase sigma factor [Cellulomonas citrea]|uniref:RNA polymerase sigma factor n=1 Tax=Cellulomonas citrea TaxID=1909423 RepID=UPI001F190594|nr:sigma-70 family RNA polymerase sigma factor [Cellulomonas citrea]
MDAGRSDDPIEDADVTELVTGALAGDERCWEEIVRRHARLVTARIRQFRLDAHQAEDVAQTVWLNLLEHLGELRDPAALPGWISTATRRECLRVARLDHRDLAVDPQSDGLESAVEQDMGARLLLVELVQAVRDGLAELPARQRDLLVLLVADPPLSYVEISRRLDIPVGSIGPTRARGLARLRTTEAMASYLRERPGTHAGEKGVRDAVAFG